MFNLHRGKQQQADQPGQRARPGGLRPEQEAERKVKLDELRKIINTYLAIKQLENSLYMTCVKKCTNIEEEILDDNETSCLKDCHRKIGLYMKIAKEVYANEKGSASEFYALLQKSNEANKKRIL